MTKSTTSEKSAKSSNWPFSDIKILGWGIVLTAAAEALLLFGNNGNNILSTNNGNAAGTPAAAISHMPLQYTAGDSTKTYGLKP